MIDLLVIVAVSALFLVPLSLLAGTVGVSTPSAAAAWLVGAVVFVTYHTATVWLTDRTLGKAIFDLSIQRLDRDGTVRPRPSGFADRSRHLGWVLLRSSVSYVPINVFGLGLLWSRRHPGQSLADWVLGSRVVHDPLDDAQSVLSRLNRAHGYLSDLRQRVSAITEPINNASWFLRLLAKIVRAALTVILIGIERIRRIIDALTGAVAPSNAPASSATAGPAMATGTLTTTTAFTLGLAMAILPPPADPLVGDWSWEPDGMANFRIDEIADDQYEGTLLQDATEPNSGCLFHSGRPKVRVERTQGGVYVGSTLWVFGYDGEDCTYAWSTLTTFDLGVDGALRYCSRTPPDHLDPGEVARQECSTRWRAGGPGADNLGAAHAGA